MSEILVAAVNASFSHTNIAVRSISLYCQKMLNVQDDFINFDENVGFYPMLFDKN